MTLMHASTIEDVSCREFLINILPPMHVASTRRESLAAYRRCHAFEDAAALRTRQIF